jgi:transposase
VRIAREQITQLRALNTRIDALHRELTALVAAHRPKLLAEQGCGALVAATMIGHTAGVQRFRSEASFALLCGTAPIPCSSGKRNTHHRLNRAGDRQLNHALHIIAITRARRDPATQTYLARKQAEGQTTKGALRCLKRHLARRFHQLLAEPAVQPSPPPRSPTTTPDIPPRPQRNVDPNITGVAPFAMPCLR